MILLKRAIGFGIDFFVISLVYNLFQLLIDIPFYGTNYVISNGENYTFSFRLDFVYMTFMVSYFAIFDSDLSGSTLGKKLVKINVLDNENEELSILESLLRAILKILGIYIFFIGPLYALIDSKNRTLYDLILNFNVGRKKEE